jgi:LPS-assembly lipoprotein
LSQIKSLASLYSLVFVLVLSGCGFQPMYGMQQDGSTVSKLKNVKVDVIADRSGQILRNYLLDMMTADSSASNKYLLKVALVETSPQSAFRRDNTARHVEIVINATIYLQNLETGKTEYTDTLTEVGSFSLGPKAEYASYSATVAEDSSRERALKILADNINLYVATYLLGKE